RVADDSHLQCRRHRAESESCWMALRSMVRETTKYSTILSLDAGHVQLKGCSATCIPPGILSWCEVVCGSFQVLAPWPRGEDDRRTDRHHGHCEFRRNRI